MFKTEPPTNLKSLENVVFGNIFAEAQIYTVEQGEAKEKKKALLWVVGTLPYVKKIEDPRRFNLRL